MRFFVPKKTPWPVRTGPRLSIRIWWYGIREMRV